MEKENKNPVYEVPGYYHKDGKVINWDGKFPAPFNPAITTHGYGYSIQATDDVIVFSMSDEEKKEWEANTNPAVVEFREMLKKLFPK